MRYRKLPERAVAGRDAGEIERDIDEEIAFHLEMRKRALMREGLSEREAAEQADREFGDIGSLRSVLRRSDLRVERRRRRGAWLTDLRQDVRYALRGFVRAPAFMAVALATLALGIGASVAIFTVVDSVVLRPLPYPEPDRLVRIAPGLNANVTLSDAMGKVPSLSASTGIAQWWMTLSGDGDAVSLHAQLVDASFFDVFRVRPALGRAFRPEERDPARSDVVILSHGLWQSRFGGDPSVVGRRIAADGAGHETREVIGVMPAGFVAPAANGGVAIDLWSPLALPAGRTLATDSTWYVNTVVGRLRDDVTAEHATTEVRAALSRARAESGSLLAEESVRTAGVVPLRDAVVGDVRTPLLILLAAVGLVLVLVSANLANLLLARGETRQPEFAMRMALGGTRGRLVRELFTESAVLAALGGAAGVITAHVILRILSVADSSGLPRTQELAVDGRILAFATVVSLVSLIAFAVLPALRAASRAPAASLGGTGRSAGPGRAGRRIGRVMIAAEVALAVVLVSGAGLLLNSLRALRAVPSGLDVDRLVAIDLAPPPARVPGEQAVLFYENVIDRLGGLPGVQRASGIHLLPFTAGNWRFPYLAEGHPPPADAPLPAANFRVTTPGYFETVGIPLLAGRDFNADDRGDGEPVLIINERMARQLWPGENAVGREIRLFGSDRYQVVGVVGNVRQHALDREPLPEMYVPHARWQRVTFMTIMLRMDRSPRALAALAADAVRDIDAHVPVTARPLADVLDESMAQRRFFAGVLSFFAGLALVLGAVGIYGVVNGAVVARIPEFGVRLALGATRGRVLADAMRDALAPVAAGIIAGTAGAIASTRLLAGILFGIGPRDPATLTAAIAVLAATAAVAAWLPVRRAGSVEPAQVLRQ